MHARAVGWTQRSILTPVLMLTVQGARGHLQGTHRRHDDQGAAGKVRCPRQPCPSRQARCAAWWSCGGALRSSTFPLRSRPTYMQRSPESVLCEPVVLRVAPLQANYTYVST